MIPLEKDTLIAFHLRASSVSGGKDWIGSVTAAGALHTRWGKTGQVNQHATKTGSRALLLRSVQEKLGKGYRKIDEYEPGRGWLSEKTGVSAGNKSDTRPSTRTSNKQPPAKLIRDSQQTLAWDF